VPRAPFTSHAFIETADGIVQAMGEEVLAFLRAAGGTGLTFVDLA
jgi:hypothetical protein